MTDLTIKTQMRSPNYNERELLSPDRIEPSMIILHYTGMQTGAAAMERLCDEAAEVSAHYMIEEGGAIHQLVDDARRAWHAGRSYWEGLTDINSASIGIEIVNKGHEFGYEDFPQIQIEKLIALLKALIKKYNVAPDKILAHSDIAPGRKIDPGEKFPWVLLAKNGIGLMPAPDEMDIEAAEDLIGNDDAIFHLLTAYGYNPEIDFEILVQEFHRHFYPDCIDAKAMSIENIAGLLSLIRQKNEL